MINTALDSLYTYIYLSTSVCLFSTTNLQNISLNKSFIHRTSQEFYYNNQITIFNFFALDSSKISKFHDSIPLNRSIDNPRKGSNETSGGRLKKPEFHEQMIASLYRPWDRLYRAKYYIATCCIEEEPGRDLLSRRNPQKLISLFVGAEKENDMVGGRNDVCRSIPQVQLRGQIQKTHNTCSRGI